MAKIFSTIKDAVFNNGKHSHPTSSTNVSNVNSTQENLDTRSMAKILIIGETGSGKSTFINYMTNFFRNGSLQNPRVAIPSKYHSHTTENFVHHENDVQNTTKSKTDSCNQYMFAHNSKQYLFLDTPGLADTRGAEQDDKNIVSIIDSVESLGGLTTVIIVVNGAVCRLTVNLRNVIARLRGNLPDIVMDNVILVLTNTTRHAANFNIGSFELNGNVYPYYMQNSAFSQDPSTWTTSARESLQYEWDQAMNEITAMLQAIDTFRTKSVAAFKTMKDIRNEIKTLMHAARLEVSQIQKMQDEIAACETALQNADNNLIQFKDYKKERVMEKTEIVDATYHSTLCQKCNHVCHEKCGLDETTTAGAQIFQRCWAIKENNCTQCPNKCSYAEHYHAKKTMKKTKEKLEDILADIKAKYDMASNDKSNYQQKITTTADAKVLLQKALNQKNEDIKQLCTQLHNLCSGFNMAQELHALIDQLEIEAAMLKNIDAKKQAAEFIRSLKEFCSMIEKNQITMQKKSPTMNIIDTERPIQGQAPRPPSTLSSSETPQTGVGDASAHSHSSNSHVDEEVLSVLRALGKKKTEKSKIKQKESKKSEEASSENSEEDKESNILAKESTNEESDSEVQLKKRQKSKKKKREPITSVPTPSPVTIDSEQLKELTVNELLSRYRSCPDQRMQNFFVYELTQRAYGKSSGPMKTTACIAEFTVSCQKYCALGLNALKQEYEKLRQRISAITEPDILKIDQVPSNILIEIAAVQHLIQRAPPGENPLTHVHFQTTQQHQDPTIPIPRNHQNAYTTVHPYSHAQNYDRLTNIDQKLQTDEQQQFHSAFSVPPQQYHANAYHHPYTYAHPSPHATQQQQFFQPIYRPNPLRQPVPLVNIQDKFDHMDITTKKYDSPYSFGSSSHSTVDTDSARGSASHSNLSTPVEFDSRDNDDRNIRQMTNVHLLSKYHDAYAHRDHEQSNALYSELKRRCYGDHPLLMQEKQELFRNISSANQSRSLAELKEAYSNIKQKIRGYLVNDDATHLNNIPAQLIVEAGTIAHLISTKTL